MDTGETTGSPGSPPVPPISRQPWQAPKWAIAPTTGESVVRYWQSWSGSPGTRDSRHTWTDSTAPYTVERLPAVGPDFHTGFAYVADDGRLALLDLANFEEFKLQPDGTYSAPVPAFEPSRVALVSGDRAFSFNRMNSSADACDASGHCVQAPIRCGRFIQVFAEHEGKVLALTNCGEALLFRDGAWCRMTRDREGFGASYACSQPQPGPLVDPTGTQFYSAVEYRGRTLIGEYPTGAIYEFDGATLKPSAISPPSISGYPSGLEAQSMAEYCGDLFVGYWPKGHVHRFDHKTGQWSLFKRFFDPYAGEGLVPYLERPADDDVYNFYGQRISALVPLGDSLYVATSNKSIWYRGTDSGSFLSAARREQYGAVYRIRRDGCRTEYR